MSDAIVLFQWYILFFVIGLAFLPITSLVFAPLFDKGYIFSKVIGSLFLSYTIFLFSTLHILPFSLLSLLIVGTGWVLINGYVFSRPEHRETIRNHWKIMLVEELLFFTALLFWSYIRGHEPSINGLEKFMDFGFVNSILRSDYFPPKDMWFASLPINYYYFGHLMTAVLTKLSLLPSYFTYNLMIATLFALTFTGGFSLIFNLVRSLKLSTRKGLFSGFLAGILVALGGNLHILYAFFAAYTPADQPVPLWQLAFKPFSVFANGYWYPNATRFIPFTIHEFPLYSFVVSDLHGHVLDIPVVLTFLALLFSMLLKFQAPKSKLPTNSKHQKSISINDLRIKNWDLFGNLLFIGFLLAVMYMTNVLDAGIYFLVFAATTFFFVYKKLRIQEHNLHWNISTLSKVTLSILKPSLIVIIMAAIFSLPFSIFFKPFASGIGVLCAPKVLTDIGHLGPLLFEAEHCQHSAWWMLLTLYGFFYFFVAILLVTVFRKKELKNQSPVIFVLILAAISTLLIIIPEFVYIKDIYPQHYRANTMFKLTYQAFIMLSLVSAFVVTGILKPRKDKILTGLSILLISLVLLYPRFAINSYYGDLADYKGLNGIAYLQNKYPGDFKAIEWINSHISGQPVMLEAQGDSYTDYERISANTGLPTILGWTVHEWLWRGTYDIPAPRISEVQRIYETASPTEARDLLNTYHVAYVYIGQLEREKYPNLSEEKFNKLGKTIYQNESVTIYKIK